MASGFLDGDQDSLLDWDGDGLLSPIFQTKHPVRHTPEVLAAASISDVNSRTPAENDLGYRDARRPPAGADRNNQLGQGSPATHPQEERLSTDLIHENIKATDHSQADGSFHNEGPTRGGLDGNAEVEVGGLLEEVMDYHSRWRAVMASVSPLPLLEEVSPADGSIISQPQVNLILLPLLTANVSCDSDPDTPPLTSSSPRSFKDSHSSSSGPPLRTKRSFTPTTPSTDGWRSPPTLAIVPEREVTYTKVPGIPGVYPPDPRQVPGNITRGNYPSVDQRARHSELPPLVTTIPQDATIHRRAQSSISSGHTITYDHGRRLESPANHPMSSYFSDDDVSETGHIDPGFETAYFSTSGALSPLFTQPHPRTEVSLGLGSSGFNSGRSPSSSAGISPGSIEYPSPSNHRYTPNSKRGVFQSLLPQNSRAPFEQKNERKRTTSSKSPKERDKDRKKAEKLAKRAQLVAEG